MNVDGYTQDAFEVRAAGIIVAGDFWRHCLRRELFLVARTVFKAADRIRISGDSGVPVLGSPVPASNVGGIRRASYVHYDP